MTIKHVYAAEIAKSYRDENGDLVVDGIATSADLDLDQQVCDPTWLKSAMPEWFHWGNIREQHGSNAAGTGTELTEGDEGRWHLKSTIVDPIAQTKVEKKVYRGYSIGIKDPRVVKDAAAPGGRIVGGTIVEVSLVDRPCNPVATLALAKAAKPGMTLKVADLDQERMLLKVCEIVEYPENADQLAEEAAVDKGAAATEKTARYPGSVDAIAALAKGIKPRARDRGQAVTHIVTEAQRLKRADLLPADLVKTAQHDPAMIAAVRDGLVACISAELQELCDGQPELCDIEQLFSSLWTLMSWWEDEAWQGETASPYSGDLGNEVALWLAAQPEQEKAMGDTTVTTDTDKTDATKAASTTEPVTEPATTTTGTLAVPAALTELVKAAAAAAVAEANTASDERYKALEAELAKVKATPVPGGPVIARTGDGNQVSERIEKAAHFRHLASTVTDRDLRTFYSDKAKALAQNGSDS